MLPATYLRSLYWIRRHHHRGARWSRSSARVKWGSAWACAAPCRSWRAKRPPSGPSSASAKSSTTRTWCSSLERNGVIQLPGPDEIDGDIGSATAERVAAGRVAITAHGVGERAMRELQASGLEIIDTTCPIVTRAQRYGQKFVREGWHVDHLRRPGPQGSPRHHGLDARRAGQLTSDDRLEPRNRRPEGHRWNHSRAGSRTKIGVMAQTTHKMEDFARFVANLMLLATRPELRTARREHALPRHDRSAGGGRGAGGHGRRDGRGWRAARARTPAT